MKDGRVKTFPTLILETFAVALESQCQTEETKGGGEETKVNTDTYDGESVEEVAMEEMIEDGNIEHSCIYAYRGNCKSGNRMCRRRGKGAVHRLCLFTCTLSKAGF